MQQISWLMEKGLAKFNIWSTLVKQSWISLQVHLHLNTVSKSKKIIFDHEGNDAEHGWKWYMKYRIILRVKALMLLSHSLKCCPCSCGWHLLSDIALLAWAVASITLIYPLPWGLDMIIGVKYSFGAALFINRLHTILFPLSAVEVSCP